MQAHPSTSSGRTGGVTMNHESNRKNCETLIELTQRAVQLCAEREWEQFNAPKNLAANLSREANELLEHFVWQPGERSDERAAERKKELSHEAADVLLTLLLFCDRAKIDLELAYREKLDIIAQRYPAEQYRGKTSDYQK